MFLVVGLLLALAFGLFVSRNVATASAGSEQMGASIREIANSAADAALVAQSAVEIALRANASVLRLG